MENQPVNQQVNKLLNRLVGTLVNAKHFNNGRPTGEIRQCLLGAFTIFGVVGPPVLSLTTLEASFNICNQTPR